jgi:hypothetical protein
MKQTKTYCDVCGKEIKPGYGVDKGSLRLVGRAVRETTKLTTINYQDICYGCTLIFFKFINKLVKEVK